MRLAVQGMDRVVRLVTRKPLLGEPRGEPPYKALINNDNGRSEGHRFLREINTLADGSPIHFLRIPSYGLANVRTMNATNCSLRDIADVAAVSQELPCSE